jgi:hypothetical protein
MNLLENIIFFHQSTGATETIDLCLEPDKEENISKENPVDDEPYETG